MDNSVLALAVSGTNVYAGGDFTIAGTCTTGCNRIAMWNGTTWSALGTGMDSTVFALAVSGTNVYAGGIFTSAGTCTTGCNYVARYGNTPTAVTLSSFNAQPGFDLGAWLRSWFK
jgi:hypothetical protein